MASDLSALAACHKVTGADFLQLGSLGAALVAGIDAALGEAALVLGVDGRADLALQDSALDLLAGFRHRDGAEQCLGVG